MTKITREEVIKLARMSNIYIDEKDIDSYIKELQEVLTYAAGLKEIAAGKEKYQMPCNYNITRPDTVIPTDPAPLLENAPAVEEKYFVVPMIIKQN